MDTPWAFSGPDTDVGAKIEQRFHNFRLTFGNRPHHRGLSATVLGRIDRGSMFHEKPYRIR